MKLYATAPGGARTDISQFYKTVTWSGSYRACARELRAEIFNPRLNTGLGRADVPIGTVMEMESDGGELLFHGKILTHSQPSDGPMLTVTCLDDGRYLANNEGWYDFKRITPETAAAQLCKEYGVAVGELAGTGFPITRKFHGVAAYKVISTLYTLAGEQNGRRYILRMEGRKLCVRAKSEGVPELVIAPGANLMAQTTVTDASKVANRVSVYNSEGKVIHTVDDAESQALLGVFRKIVTQRKGEDAAKTAKAVLEDNQLTQKITVTVDGDTRMISGEAAALVDYDTGAAGLFWIDSDSHTWTKGLYTAKLELNFRNLMDESTAGSVK